MKVCGLLVVLVVLTLTPFFAQARECFYGINSLKQAGALQPTGTLDGAQIYQASDDKTGLKFIAVSMPNDSEVQLKITDLLGSKTIASGYRELTYLDFRNGNTYSLYCR